MKDKFITSIIMVIGCLAFLSGCSTATNIKVEEIVPIIQQIGEVSYSQKAIIALGEATHGNKELTQLKLTVFKQLVEQQNIHVFALEGDMGGCRKVNDYIQGGEGTPEQAVSEIGFAIYRTQEMADLVEWMRSFNEGKTASEQIRFYGYDMQRYDNSKLALLQILDNAAPELSQQYASLLKPFTDDTMYELDTDAVKAALADLEILNSHLIKQGDTIIPATSEMDFTLAKQYAECIRQLTELLLTDKDYGTKRDAYMADNVEWLLRYEETFYGDNRIFITGHNGHIGKTTATVGTEKIMGELLAEKYGDEYFPIGTEFYDSTFLAADYNTGERQEYRVINDGNKRLAVLLHHTGNNSLYLNMEDENVDSNLAGYLNEKQPMSSIGDMFADSFSNMKRTYTQNIAPHKAYNAIIFLDTLTPSTMLDTK